MFNLINIIEFFLAQNEKQKSETFILLAVFSIISCILIAGMWSKSPYTKEKKIQKPLILIAFMVIFVFFLVYIAMKYMQ